MSVTTANPLQAPSASSKPHSNEHVGHLELHIFTRHVGLYPQPPENITSDTLAHSAMTSAAGAPNTTSLSDSTCLLSGRLDDFHLYSGRERSQWLIDIAHDICDPSLKRGLLRVWDGDGPMWRTVNPTDPLTASTYFYDVQVVVSLSKISLRQGKSRTSASGSASTMAYRVMQRDRQRCWVTGMVSTNINSHVCPKRMGDHLLRVVYGAFVSTPPPAALSIYDEICGITLSRNLDTWFDTYELGLRFVAPDVYECHSFVPPDWPPLWQRTIFGGSMEIPPAYMTLLHGFRISPPEPQHARNPPPGLFRWQYLQCVIRKFAHSDYRNLPNICYHELPLPMEGDSDDEGTDSEFEWPSAALDRGRAMHAAIEDHEERHRFVEEWISTV